MALFLIRHPQPLVAAGICYGRSDLAVDPAEQARVLAAVLPNLPAGAELWSSPLQRCAGLAHALAAALGGAAPRCDARLAELDFGAWEMQGWDTIPRAEVDAWAADVIAYRPGGGESVLQMAERVHAFDAALRAGDAANAIVVCHAGTIRLLQACRRGLLPPQMAFEAAQAAHALPYGALIRLEN